MAKKKRKPAKRRFFSGFKKVFGAAFKSVLRLVPAAALGALLFIGFVKVRSLLYADPALEIRELRILPPDVLPAPLKAELDRRWLGRNIFTADVGAVAHFLTQEPAVLRAETVKSFPSALTIRIVQRRPFARIRFTPAGPAGIISEDGMILRLDADSETPWQGPELEALETGWKKPVKGRRMVPKGFERAVDFFRQFQRHPLAAHESLTRLRLDYLGNLSVTLGQGPDVKLGRRPVEMLQQLQKIDPFLEPGERAKIQYVDLQFEDVIVKRRSK